MDVIEKPITPPSQTNTTPNLNNGVLEQNEAIKLFKQGRDAWNQWAKVNPEASVDFSGVDFTALAKVSKNVSTIDFSGFFFPEGKGYVHFDNAIFGDEFISFRNTSFGDGNISFFNSKFVNGAISFRNATFGNGNICFRTTQFGDGSI